jgi:4-hydroxyacetophenone monooxygenase
VRMQGEALPVGEDRAGDDVIGDAIAVANVPTLLMVLVQLTGERHWLQPPYRPHRAAGLGDNDSGGLPEHVQAEIRDAALRAILAHRAGRPMAIPEPDSELLVEMLSCAMDERVPPEYGPLVAAQLGLRPMAVEQRLPVPDSFHVLVVGAGVSGLCVGYNLQQAGVPFTIIEKRDTVGGTWLENRYPGAGVDTPNHLYSFSFAPYDWSMYFALRDELHAYLEHVADCFDLRRSIRFQTMVERAEYDEPSQRWHVTVRTSDGAVETLTANAVVSGVGIFNPPVVPDLPGLDQFEGPAFHTAYWPAGLDLQGKRVAIVGNGASAMQIAPEIQPDVEALTIFQRSPQWAAPFEHFRKPVPEPLRSLLREVPLYRGWYRARLGWTFNDRIHPTLQKDPGWAHPERSLNAVNDVHRQFFTEYIVSEIGDRRDLLERVVPAYPPFGKRMLMDNGWYRMLAKPNVELVTDAVGHVAPRSVVTEAGRSYPADVLVLATGFDVLRFVSAYDVVGRGGRSLRDVWDDDDARAYLGLTVPGFPNFFCLYGPNLQTGHGGSLIFSVEMQVHYLMDLLHQMFERGVGAVEVRPEVHDAYNDGLDRAHEQMVWTHPGMTTYYRNRRGRVVVNFPHRNVDLFERTQAADLGDYRVEPIT